MADEKLAICAGLTLPLATLQATPLARVECRARCLDRAVDVFSRGKRNLGNSFLGSRVHNIERAAGCIDPFVIDQQRRLTLQKFGRGLVRCYGHRQSQYMNAAELPVPAGVRYSA